MTAYLTAAGRTEHGTAPCPLTRRCPRAKPAHGQLFSDELQADYQRLKARGAELTMPPTDVTASKIATLNDTCGNLMQVTQPMRG